MKLSDVVGQFSGKMVSDGTFTSVAFATDPLDVPFLTFFEKEKFAPFLQNPHISCVLTRAEYLSMVPSHVQGIFLCEDPKFTLFQIHNELTRSVDYIGETTKTVIGEGCSISPLAYIASENIVIGNHVTIEPFAVIKGRTTIGDNVVVRSGAMIGCKGFNFSKDSRGEIHSVIDAGRVVIENNVELFEGSIVTSGMFPWNRTCIKRNTKVGPKCVIGHGSIIGKNCWVAARAFCCGNSRIGDNVWIGVGGIVSNRITVEENARVSIGSVVTKNVPTGQTVTGNFAIEHKVFMSNLKRSIEEK